MIALVGYAGVLVALFSSFLLIVRGVQVARGDAMDAAPLRPPVIGLVAGAVVAFLAIELALVANDFSIAYVADNNSRSTPLLFTIASGWAALEGSIVLWGLVLAGFVWTTARGVGEGDRLGAGALAVLGAISVFWFGMMATIADPFRLCTDVVAGFCSAASALPLGAAVAPADGVGANPLLQNHILMAVHPPMLYLGYVGFSVPFAFAISALAQGVRGSAWLDRTHRWSLVAWTFLTLGIILGGWWSYEVLGWGGYWAWDPVENAAILPWLAGTAFIHSAVVQRRRGMLQAWNIVLVISTFALTILGTFLTRSGVIQSVHSFTQSAVGPALLGFMVVALLGSLALLATRSHLVAQSPRLESLASREGVFLLNNLLLTVFAFAVLVGTLYPLVVEALQGDAVSVGRPFFDRVSLPISFLLLLAMGTGPITPYRVARPEVVWERVWTPIRVALVAGAVVVLAGYRSVGLIGVTILSTFVVSVILRLLLVRVRARRDAGDSVGTAVARLFRNEPGFWGGQVAHIGVAIVAFGIGISSILSFDAEVTIDTGQSVDVGAYTLTYVGPFTRDEPNRQVEGARLTLSRDGDVIRTMEPRLHLYDRTTTPVATPDVRTGLVDDVYLSLSRAVGNSVTLRVFIFPFMWLLWAGGMVIVAGGAWSYLGVRLQRDTGSKRRAEVGRRA